MLELNSIQFVVAIPTAALVSREILIFAATALVLQAEILILEVVADGAWYNKVSVFAAGELAASLPLAILYLSFTYLCI